jgi:hypothetical protein
VNSRLHHAPGSWNSERLRPRRLRQYRAPLCLDNSRMWDGEVGKAGQVFGHPGAGVTLHLTEDGSGEPKPCHRSSECAAGWERNELGGGYVGFIG